MNAQTQMVAGSLQAIAELAHKSIAEAFTDCDIVILVDTSGSMGCEDSRGKRSRYDVACEELANLQQHLAGKIAVIVFSDETIFCPSGIPPFLGGGTNMAKALQFAKIADVPGMQFILISDGEPENEDQTLRVAKTYQNPIDTIYVGPEDEPLGREFLERLAAATAGKTVSAERAKTLQAGIERLLPKKL